MEGSPAVPMEEVLLAGRSSFVAFVAKRVSDPDLAEDIVQNSLLKAVQAAPALDEQRLTSWFYRVLNNAIIDAYRRRGVERRRVVHELPDVPDAQQELEREICACFRELLPGLKPEYGELIRRLDLDAEQPEAVAASLGITTNNLKVRRHRARQALRDRLEDACGTCAQGHCLDCDCVRT